MRKSRLVVATALLVVVAAHVVAAADADREKAAEVAARSWLGLVDAGRYGESWDAAASVFRQALSRRQWEEALQKVRGPLGKVVSRKLRGAKFTTEIPGAPVGEYVVIQYDTDFAKRAGAIETITPMKDSDGAWRISGYYIK